MVSYKIHDEDSSKLIISGKTYNFREQIKLIGGKWINSDKVWIVENTQENVELIKKMKHQRTCGWCDEIGHAQPKCPEKLKRTAEELLRNPGTNFKKLINKEYCDCKIVETDYGIVGFCVKIPVTCVVCQELCCKFAIPLDNAKSIQDYTCPNHGTSAQQFLNDTRGT